jgi:predicted transposase YdaD
MRITIDNSQAMILIEAISKITMRHYENLTKEELMTLDRISDKIEDEQRREVSPKKKKAMIEATNARIQKAKEKIENAINILRMENRPITIYSVSKESGVSYNTASKYSELIKNA